jgi:protein HIRA/HIR1
MIKEDFWNPMLLGHWKRDLLKEVLQVFSEHEPFLPRAVTSLSSLPARSKTLAKLGMDWQDLLKKASASDG